MTPGLIFTITLIAAAVVALVVFARREAGKHGTSAKEEFVGICKSAIETASQKEERKERALALLRSRGKLSNSEIREALLVSGRSVRRYLDELEQEGKVEQVGEVGRSVVYRLK